MNKYSSKAVKTAATVGMSLAMVLGNVAPVLAAYPSTVTEMNEAETVIGKIEDGMAAAGLTIETIKGGEQFKYDGTDVTIFAWNTTNGYELNSELNTIIGNVVNKTVYKSESYYKALRIKEIADSLNAMVTYATTEASDANVNADTVGATVVNKAKSAIYDTNLDASGMLTIDAYANALKVKELFDKYAQYEENLPLVAKNDTKKTYSYTEYMTAKEDLIDAIETFEAAHYGDTLDKYLTDLEDLYEDFVENETSTGDKQITKVEVDALLKGLKNSTLVGGFSYNGQSYANLTKNNYNVFKEDEGVISLLEQFEALVTDYEDIRDAVSKKNESYVEYTKTKINNVTTKNYMTTNTFEDIYANLTDERWAIVKDYKENVLDVVLTLDAKEVGKTYVEKSTKSPYVSDTELTRILNDFATSDNDGGNPSNKINSGKVDVDTKAYGLFSFYDKDENVRYWDKLAEHMEGLDDALKAVTTDIEKLTPANIKVTDKELLEAAEDAIFELTTNPELGKGYGGYAKNLTSKQTRTVKQADVKITNLREAFDNLGTTTVAGWYDMGNGNWGYNNEDGTPAAYKWVASGSNWYFVKDGKMVRSSWLATDGGRWYYLDNEGKMVTNQSVDGCWINSYGVYMSPSYNG